MNDTDLRRRNLALLKETSPEVHKALAGVTPADPPPAVPDGPPRVTARVCMEPPRPEGRHPYLTRFVADLIQAARDMDIPFFPYPTFTLSPVVAVIGNVAPAGLRALLDQTGCIFLFIVAGNRGELLAQMDIIDWAATDAALRARGGGVTFLLAHTPDGITASLTVRIAAAAPFALDAMTVASFDRPDLARAVADAMTRRAYRALVTLGTLYDGILMLRNSEINLRRGATRLYCNKATARLDLPAWIVGSGPSLDGSLAFLAANQDKAVIISCGSALSALLAAGIRPDFHIELENIEVAPTLAPALRFDLGGIRLVAPASVDPVVLEMFDDIIFSFRQNLPNQPLYGVPASAMPALGEPTVANLGLAFAREQGFPEICFFGVDMGARAPEKGDHAANTWHAAPDSDYRTVAHPLTVPANFGGDCRTTTGLAQALHALEVAIAHDLANSRGRRYMNCSDGARIGGAEPLRAEDLKVKAPARPKSESVAAIFTAFEPWDPARLPPAWPGPAMLAEIRTLLAAVRAEMTTVGTFGKKDYLARLGRLLRFGEGHSAIAPPGPESAARMTVRGAIGTLILFLEYYLNRTTSPQNLDRLGRAGVALMEREWAAIEADCRSWIGGNAVGTIPSFRDLKLPEETRFPAMPTIPRNAPCPCGSGQRFKQCHGKTA